MFSLLKNALNLIFLNKTYADLFNKTKLTLFNQLLIDCNLAVAQYQKYRTLSENRMH